MSYENIRSFLDAERQAQAAFLAELVKVPSDNPPGDCAPHAARTAELIEALGYTVERHPVPDDQVRANGMISAVNLVVRRRFGEGGGPVVALNAHGDVVPPGEGWTKDPYGAEVVDGWMYGRGVAVSKSDFATYTWALKALEACGAELEGTVELHLTYDEEAGGNIGPGFLLRENIAKPDVAISAGLSMPSRAQSATCSPISPSASPATVAAARRISPSVSALAAASAQARAKWKRKT